MNSKYIDFTGSSFMGNGVDLLQQSISFERCAHIVANAFLNGLIKSGLPLEQAFNVYTSKAFRHKLDWDLEDKLEKIAHKAGKEVGEEYRKLYKKNREQYGWMNDELNITTQQEIERRLEHCEQ
ncbi:hypothetical protein EBR43_12240, partial [bacterium]|nr:hypothetical protein [bacterium]